MNLNNLSVSRKLWGIVVGLLAVMLVLGAALLSNLARVNEETSLKVQATGDRIALALRWRGLTETNVQRVLMGAISTDEAYSQSLQPLIKAGIETISGLQKQVVAAATSPEDKAQLERVAADRAVVLKSIDDVRQARASGDAAATQSLVDGTLLPAVAKYLGSQDAFVELQQKEREDAKVDGEARRATAQWIGVAIAGIVVVIGGLLAAFVVPSITRPLDRAVSLADAIAAGDLTVDVHDERKDELGHLLRSLNAMAARLRGVVADVRGGVESVSSAANEIASGNHDLSARTEQTAANLEETASSMEELTATVTQSADTARQANQLAATAAQAAARGGEVVGQVVSSMQQITDSSRKISDIIGVIDGIAFQTNILALNAAVEAARAGEQGRGFAVVAGEVRSLAQRSAEAAKEIKTLIGTSVDNVESGSQQVAQAGQSMTEIVSSVRRVSDLIGEITASSSEQRDGIGQVNQAVANLDQMTQQNAALVEQSSAAAAAMRDQAQRLAQVVSVFNVGAQAVSYTPAARPARAPVSAARAPAALPAKSTPPKVGHKPAAIPKPATNKAPAAAAAPRLANTPAPAPRAVAAGSDDDWETF